MAFRADLEFDDLKFRVIEFTYEFRTPTEAASGQVSGRMIGGMLTFEVEVSAVNNLWLYQTENREIDTGKIMFRQTEADSPMRTITFKKGHVIHLTERYSAVGGQPLTMRFTVSSQSMVLGGNSVVNEWSRTDV